MLDTGASNQPAPTIVVGRFLSAYFASDVQNNQETITYTIYNQQSDPVTGVLLTTTLEPGVTIAGSSQQPDQSGQKLAWNMGTIEGFARASVSVTVNLASPAPLVLDAGALFQSTLVAATRARLAEFFTLSQIYTDLFSRNLEVKAYFDSPRIAIMSARADSLSSSTSS
jgi:hypothetical protein